MRTILVVLIVLIIFFAIWILRLKMQNKKLRRDLKISDQSSRFFLNKLERERNKDCDCH